MTKEILILKLALVFNKQLYEENKITYQMYKYTEDNLLKELGDCY